jgi:hypothetical protein
MKVLTATVLAWLLHKGSDAALWVSSQLFVRAIRVEDWAGIGLRANGSFGWIVGEAVGGYVDSHEYKAGGTSSDD